MLLTRTSARTLLTLALCSSSTVLSACTRYFASDPTLDSSSGAVLPMQANAPRALYMFEGSTGRTLGWSDLMAAASWADAVFVGERHDDPTAHAVQLAIFEDLAAGYPRTALALEHLERHEQSLVDRYLRGEITADAFIDESKSRNWAGEGTWVKFFQPLIDAARESGSPVIAANAPRDYVRRARSEGHAALATLASPERALYDLPLTKRTDWGSDEWNARWDAYQARFREIMASEGEDPNAGEVRARLDDGFLSQSTWDGTMGASAAHALATGSPKVVVCAGCFHIERDGGTVLQFEARCARGKVLTVTVIDDTSRVLREEDRGAADVVIYGFPVTRASEEVKPAEVVTPAATPESTPASTPDSTPASTPASTPEATPSTTPEATPSPTSAPAVEPASEPAATPAATALNR